MKPDTHIRHVTSFEELVSTSFVGSVNALCWHRNLEGDFAEIVTKLQYNGNITTIEKRDLQLLVLSEQGQLARTLLLDDLNRLEAIGALPTLNVIRYYERDETNSFFPTDVYSFHADRSAEPTSTFLCTYYGEPSDVLPNEQAEQKIRIPEIRSALQQEYGISDTDFETFVQEHFFDLHYQPKPTAVPISLGKGNLWKVAVDCPGSQVLPCIHRAPLEKNGEPRLLLIC